MNRSQSTVTFDIIYTRLMVLGLTFISFKLGCKKMINLSKVKTSSTPAFINWHNIQEQGLRMGVIIPLLCFFPTFLATEAGDERTGPVQSAQAFKMRALLFSDFTCMSIRLTFGSWTLTR